MSNNLVLIERLKDKLSGEGESGKHALYQSLPISLKGFLGEVEYQPSSRYEHERFKVFQQFVDFTNKKVIDIGCNLGFFSFSALTAGAATVHSFEGSSSHAQFIEDARQLLSLECQLEIENKYFDFECNSGTYDIGLLLNVLHHVGDDYGSKELVISDALTQISSQLNGMSSLCQCLIFQLGFNWHGNNSFPLFEFGTKREMIDFIQQVTKGNWIVEKVLVAERSSSQQVEYKEVNDSNVERDDSLGEFLNRPIFILKSLK